MKLTKVAALSVAAVLLTACSDDGVRHTPDATAPIDGAVDASPDATVNPAMLSGSPGASDFGDVVIGQTTSKVTYTIANDGDQPSGTVGVLVDPQTAGFALSDNTCSGVTLGSHGTCTFAVAFTPGMAGTSMATLHIAATPGGEIARDLTGNGLQPGALDITEASHDFTKLAIDATPTTHTFTVKNTGQVATGIPTPSITGTASSYAIQSTTCTAALSANATCSVVVKFGPTTVGSKPATLVVTGSPGGSDSATLSGVGVAHVAVTKTGNGSGVVMSNMTGVNCGSACAADFSVTPVTLTATPDTGTTFAGWTGGCTGTSPCTLDLTAGKTVAANFTLQRFALTTSKTGNGNGTITGAGTYDYNTPVTVTATAATGSTFTGFGGDCSGMTCTVTMTQARNVTASFALQQFTLTTSTTGTGQGTITGAGTYDYNTPVTVTASAATGYTFTGFGGDCSGMTCTLRMTANHVVSANFVPQRFTLTTSKTGNGNGTITGAGTYDYNTPVTVTAVAATGSTFIGFGGDCSGMTCTVTMTQARNVTANFALQQFTLTTSTTGTGQGTITGAGTYDYNTPVTVTASAATGYTFTGFGGDCSGMTCTLRMTANHVVSANFVPQRFTLTTSTTGNGQGTITGAGTYDYNTPVTVTASADISSTFSGFGGDCSGTTCTVMMTANHAVTADFTLKQFTLTTSTTGAGTGTVSGAGTYNYGQPVTVSASAGANSRFASWGGDCAGSGPCTVTMTADHAVSADFEPTVYSYTVTAVTQDPQYYSVYVTYPSSTSTTAECVSTASPGTACGATLPAGTVVNLVAHLPPVSYPSWHNGPTWYGCDSVSSDGYTCTITLSYARSVSVYGDTLALIGRTR